MVGQDWFRAAHGMSHGDDLSMLYKLSDLPFDGVVSDEDKAVSKEMLTLFTNFAINGNPTTGKTYKWER